MAGRIIIASLFIYLFRIFLNYYLYPLCISYLYKNHNLNTEFVKHFLMWYHNINICGAGVLLAYLIVLKFPNLI